MSDGLTVPLAPYFLVAQARSALLLSASVTLFALVVFGFVEGRFTGAPPARSAMQTALIGGLAAGAAFLIAHVIS